MLGLLHEHGGQIVHRATGDRSDRTPAEVQFFAFADQAGPDGDLLNIHRVTLTEEHERVIDPGRLFPVTFVSPREPRELT
jgi:hypothetical protein